MPRQIDGHSHAAVVTEQVKAVLVSHAPIPKKKPKPSFASDETWATRDCLIDL